VRRFLASSLLSLLLLTVVAGGCVSCEQYFMLAGANSCCAPDGHCRTNNAVSRECKQIAFDSQKPADLYVDLPVAAATLLDLPFRPTLHWDMRGQSDPVEPSPPDLQVLHSTFLI
jgi:hypothetical protein